MRSGNLRIVFLGINTNGKRVHDWLVDQGEEIVALITTKKGLEQVAALHPDLIISGGFRHILPKEILRIPRLGCINFHKAYLPHNRGANPNVWTIIDGTTAGVSIHHMDDGIDTGPILAQHSVPTDFSDTGKTLYDRLEEAQIELFTDFWPKFKAGQIVPKPQTDKGTYHRISDLKKLRRIGPEETFRAGDLLNLLRAMTFPPFDNCHVEIEGKRYFLRLEISEAKIDAGRTDKHGMLRQYDDER